MIDLYVWPTPNGRKIFVALEEMGLPYTVHPIDIMKDEQFRPEFLAISPNNKIPGIVDHETSITMFESGAILLYLVMEWLMWQMAGFGPMLGRVHHFVKFNSGKAPYAEEHFLAEARRLYGVLDRRLAGQPYMCGDYSIADMATFPWAARFEWQKVDLGEFANVKRWYRAIAERPAVKRAYAVPGMTADIPMPA
jgi:GSH-dependent disulfide-bond oxidoreductase